MVLIRNHYEEVFEEIVRQHGEGEDPPSFEIDADCTLHRAIGYTKQFVFEYRRYGHYTSVLYQALPQLDFRPADKPIVHLDLGCGPGVFSWAVRDHMIEKYGMKDSDLIMIGYDHAPNMIKLAHLFRDHLPIEFNLKGYSDVADIISSENFSDCDVIVTLGYVLIQTEGDPDARKDFAEIVQSLLKSSNSCILIASDSHSPNYPENRQIFGEACNQLETALRERRMNLTKPQSTFIIPNCMYAHLNLD